MDTKKIIVSSFVVAGVILITGCAGKFHKGNFKNFVFERFDKNQNGKLNEKEYFNIISSRFERLDSNENGTITKDELNDSKFSKMQSKFANYYLNKYDLNKNREITKLEVVKQTKNEFIDLDTNKDGSLSKSEFKKQKSPFNK